MDETSDIDTAAGSEMGWRGARRRARHLRWLAAVVVAALLAFSAAGLAGSLRGIRQLDFDTYYWASRIYQAGGNPLDHDQLASVAGPTVLPFVYPHHTLVFFRLFATADHATGSAIYLSAKLVCLSGLVFLWMRHFVGDGCRGWFLLFAILGYNGATCRDVVFGNISTFEQLLVWLGLYALIRGRLWWFSACVILAAQFKVLPVVLLGLMLLVDAPGRWRCLAISLLVCVVCAVGVYLSDPVAARSFVRQAMEMGPAERGSAFNPCVLSLLQHVAMEMTRRFAWLRGQSPEVVGYGVYGLFVAVVLAVFAWRVRLLRVPRLRVFWAVLTYGLIAPRMKDYSYMLLLVPTFELIRTRLAATDAERWPAAVLAAALTLPGLDGLWEYRCLLMAALAWALSVGLAGWQADQVGCHAPANEQVRRWLL